MQPLSAYLRHQPGGAVDSIAATKPPNLLRWFSIISFILISAIAIGLGFVSTRFLVIESLERDAISRQSFVIHPRFNMNQ